MIIPPKLRKTMLELILAIFDVLKPDERMGLVATLKNKYCLECGSDDPNCKCWNEE